MVSGQDEGSPPADPLASCSYSPPSLFSGMQASCRQRARSLWGSERKWVLLSGLPSQSSPGHHHTEHGLAIVQEWASW